MSNIIINAPCPKCAEYFSTEIPLMQDFGARSENILNATSFECPSCNVPLFLSPHISIRTAITTRRLAEV